MAIDTHPKMEEDDSDSSTEKLKMPSPTLSATTAGDDDEAPPDLRHTDSWEDGDDGDEGEEGGKCGEAQQLSVVRNFDSFLSSWVDWSSCSFKTDQGLKLLQWSLWLASRLSRPLALAGPLSYSSPCFLRNPELSPALRKMYADMSLVRYALRLYGLPSSLEAVRSGSWSAGWDDPRIHKLGQVMAWSMVFYYPFEHVAYGRWVVPNLITVDAERHSAISCRFWTLYIVADFVSSVLKLKEIGKRAEQVVREESEGKLSSAGANSKRLELAKLTKHQRLHLARCALFVVPAIHWSLPKWEREPWLPEGVVNGLMLAESITCFYQSICAMKK